MLCFSMFLSAFKASKIFTPKAWLTVKVGAGFVWSLLFAALPVFPTPPGLESAPDDAPLDVV
jgi:hypothetical protein